MQVYLFSKKGFFKVVVRKDLEQQLKQVRMSALSPRDSKELPDAKQPNNGLLQNGSGDCFYKQKLDSFLPARILLRNLLN